MANGVQRHSTIERMLFRRILPSRESIGNILIEFTVDYCSHRSTFARTSGIPYSAQANKYYIQLAPYRIVGSKPIESNNISINMESSSRAALLFKIGDGDVVVALFSVYPFLLVCQLGMKCCQRLKYYIFNEEHCVA